MKNTILTIFALLAALAFISGGFAGRAIERESIRKGMDDNNYTFCPVDNCYGVEEKKEKEWADVEINVSHILRDAK